MRDKIDRTVMKALMEVEKLEKLFANNGAFENAVSEIGGDIGWFGDVRNNLKQLYSNIEELHMGAVSHMDMDESIEDNIGMVGEAKYSIKNTKTGQVYHHSKYPISKDNEKLKKIRAAGGDHIHAAPHKDGKPLEEAEIELAPGYTIKTDNPGIYKGTKTTSGVVGGKSGEAMAMAIRVLDAIEYQDPNSSEEVFALARKFCKEMGCTDDAKKRVYKELAKIGWVEPGKNNAGMVGEAAPDSILAIRIKDAFGKIYDLGDAGLDYLEDNAPLYAQLMNKHKNDLDRIIAKEKPQVLAALSKELLQVLDRATFDLEESLYDIKKLAGIAEAAKPDFADIDDDGDTEETMKKAAKDKEANESLNYLKKLAGIVESEHEEEDDDDDDDEEKDS